LEWPYCKQCTQTNFDQTIHGHPVVGGYISRRILDYPIRELPPHFKLPTQTNDIIKYPVSLDNVGRWALHYSGVRWIVLNLQDDQYKPDEIPQFLDTFAEPGPIYRDDTMAVYYARQPDSGPSEYLELRDGWSGSEFTPDRQLWTRWFATAGTFMAWNLSDESHRYSIGFDAWSYAQPRRLQVVVDHEVVGQWDVQDLRHFDIPITLTRGRHLIELVSLDPPVSPAAVNQASNDTRPLAFNISNLELHP
jgi:hypothetical protein